MLFCSKCGYVKRLCRCLPHNEQRRSDTQEVNKNNDSIRYCKYCDLHQHHHDHSAKKTCKESLTELISAAANIENALADAINAETYKLKSGNFTPKELLQLTTKLENLLKLVIKKEIVLEFLIEDAKNACKEIRKSELERL